MAETRCGSGSHAVAARGGGRVEPGPPERRGRNTNHPEHGWLAFVFPKEHAAMLGVALVKHAGMCEYFASAAAPTTVAVN